jgi:hypothetical protein
MILGAKRVTGGQFQTEYPQMLGETGQNLFATVNWPPVFVHHWLLVLLFDMFSCLNAFINKIALELVNYAPVCVWCFRKSSQCPVQTRETLFLYHFIIYKYHFNDLFS